jgi:hypothetical protein
MTKMTAEPADTPDIVEQALRTFELSPDHGGQERYTRKLGLALAAEVTRLTADCARKDLALRQVLRILCDYEADAEDSTVSNMIADIHDVLGDFARGEGSGR